MEKSISRFGFLSNDTIFHILRLYCRFFHETYKICYSSKRFLFIFEKYELWRFYFLQKWPEEQLIDPKELSYFQQVTRKEVKILMEMNLSLKRLKNNVLKMKEMEHHFYSKSEREIYETPAINYLNNLKMTRNWHARKRYTSGFFIFSNQLTFFPLQVVFSYEGQRQNVVRGRTCFYFARRNEKKEGGEEVELFDLNGRWKRIEIAKEKKSSTSDTLLKNQKREKESVGILSSFLFLSPNEPNRKNHLVGKKHYPKTNEKKIDLHDLIFSKIFQFSVSGILDTYPEAMEKIVRFIIQITRTWSGGRNHPLIQIHNLQKLKKLKKSETNNDEELTNLELLYFLMNSDQNVDYDHLIGESMEEEEEEDLKNSFRKPFHCKESCESKSEFDDDDDCIDDLDSFKIRNIFTGKKEVEINFSSEEEVLKNGQILFLGEFGYFLHYRRYAGHFKVFGKGRLVCGENGFQIQLFRLYTDYLSQYYE